MRAIFAAALLALLAVASVSASIARASPRGTQAPWKIIESWTKQMPGGNAMDINPVYNSLRSIYFTTSYNGTVFAVNTTDHVILWQRNWDDITFIQAVDQLDSIIVGRSAGTELVLASTGETLWTNTSIIIMADLSNHGDRNFIAFGDANNLTLAYREVGLGYARVCALNANNGARIWCDPTYRTTGLPDASYNNTLTAPLFDASGAQYAGSFNVTTGQLIWIVAVDTVLTGSADFVAVTNGTALITLDAMTGIPIAAAPMDTDLRSGTAVFVHTRILTVCDSKNWIAAMDATNGAILWNVSTPVTRGQMQLQRRGEDVLVFAVLTDTTTNFSRIDAYEGNLMWTVSARPTGQSLAAVHAWLGNDILYVRDVTNSWSAYGVDSGSLISTGSGELFLPRSVAANYFEPHVGYFVTGPEGIVYALKIVPRN